MEMGGHEDVGGGVVLADLVDLAAEEAGAGGDDTVNGVLLAGGVCFTPVDHRTLSAQALASADLHGGIDDAQLQTLEIFNGTDLMLVVHDGKNAVHAVAQPVQVILFQLGADLGSDVAFHSVKEMVGRGEQVGKFKDIEIVHVCAAEACRAQRSSDTYP